MNYENSGLLFKNDRKDKDSQPDYTGKWNDATGREYQLAAWIKQGTKGKYMSLKASEKREGEKREPINDPAMQGPPDDEIPF